MQLSWHERGDGPPLLLLHETAASAAIWQPLVDALGPGVRTIALDRRGWGASGAPEEYVATTIEEQAADAVALMRELGDEPAVVCGAGLGAVVALELLLRHGDLARAAALVEPPLLAFLPEATEGIGADRQAIADAVSAGGPGAAVELYLAGGLPGLGAGAERIPAEIRAAASQRPLSLFAELGAVPAWSLRSAEMQALEAPARVVVGGATPRLLRTACERLTPRLGEGELVDLGGDGLPHVERAQGLAELIGELL